jgi:hypothetical protein
MAGQTAGPRGLKFGIVTLTDPGSNMGGGVKVGSEVKVTKAMAKNSHFGLKEASHRKFVKQKLQATHKNEGTCEVRSGLRGCPRSLIAKQCFVCFKCVLERGLQ